MITPRIKPSSFFPEEEAVDDLFLARQRKAKLEGYVQTLAAIDALVDFTAMAAAVDAACPRADRKKGGRPPYPTEALVRMVFLQGLYNLSDEQCEYQVLDRLSFQRFCRLGGALNIPDARTIWSFRQRLAQGGLGGRAIFETLSQQLQQHGFIPRGAAAHLRQPGPAGWQVRAGGDAGAHCAGHHAAVRGVQRVQAGVAHQKHGCVCEGRVRSKRVRRGPG